jgi:ABC-type uncharacterized transport system substrate-binding protein
LLPRANAFVEGLWVVGYVEGRTVAFERKSRQDQGARLPDLAAELAGSQVDVVVTGGMPAAKGLMALVGDPMGAGLVESLGRPGGKPMSLIVRDEKERQLFLGGGGERTWLQRSKGH